MAVAADEPKIDAGPSKINWNLVYYFTEVASVGSIKAVSERLNLSSSTLSAHITQLEKDLKVVLFNRLHRRLTLTPTGMKLFQQTKQMFETGTHLLDVLSSQAAGGYPISMALVPSFSLRMTYHFISRYVEANPRTNLKAQSTSQLDLEKGLAEAKYDFGFTDQLPDSSEILFQELASGSIAFFVSARLAKKNLKKLFENYPLLAYSSNSKLTEELGKCIQTLGFNFPNSINSDYPGLLLDLCQNGQGIGVFATEPFQYMQKGILKKLDLPPEIVLPTVKLYVLWHKSGENTNAVKNMKKAFQVESLFAAPLQSQSF